ncbi:MAG: isochorismatase family cysteine hydrolase [Chloroflexota bacterium]|nr:isochorismatase family cysteine hydrolase [Chloroflexota bacterium]
MSLAEHSTKFLNYLESWLALQPTVTFDELITEPQKTAIISVDVINGFLYEGPLSSPRVAPIGESIAELMQAAWDRGLRDILLVQDGHSKDSLEFDAFGKHAVKGTHQAETIDEIKDLPFHNELTKMFKDSVHPALNNGFDDWVDQRKHITTFIAVGDVTDICVYQLATYLKLRANAYHQERRVIVPANCVQTWHLSVEDAKDIPAMPHHGDMLHATFLYHMALNGIDVVTEIKT